MRTRFAGDSGVGTYREINSYARPNDIGSLAGMPGQPCIPTFEWDSTLLIGNFVAPSMRLSREQRRALEKLADASGGISEEVLIVAHGFSADMLDGLVLAGLATVVTATRKHRGFTVDIDRIQITTEGQRAIEG